MPTLLARACSTGIARPQERETQRQQEKKLILEMKDLKRTNWKLSKKLQVCFVEPSVWPPAPLAHSRRQCA